MPFVSVEKTAKKGITVPKSVRLSLDITIIYGTLLTSVPVAVVHISSKKNCKKHYVAYILSHSPVKVKAF